MAFRDPTAQRRYQRKWKRNRRLSWLQGKTCATCGESDLSRLEVHHVDPDQKEDHNVWSWTPERAEAELAKCIVLCRRCHKQEHVKLNPSKAAAIRLLYRETGASQRQLAEAFNVGQSAIYDVIHANSWAWTIA